MAIWIIVIYALILLSVSVMSYRKGFVNIFSTEKRLPWILAGFSLFAINPETINVLSKMGIAAEEGYSGMWIFYTGVFGVGLLPVVFAPLWSRLKFMTDNQFILFRFSGISSRILHLFRAAYVGYLVVALFIAQVFIGLSKLLIVFFELTYVQSFLIIGFILIFIIAKNSLRLKIRTDFLNGIIYILAFAAGAFFVIKQFGGFSEMYPKLISHYPGHIRLFPTGFEKTSFGSLPTLLVYFFIQWWSINVLDGAGPEAQRYMNTKSPFQAFKAAFLPLILFSIVFLLHSFVIDAGIIMVNESAGLLPIINGQTDIEAGFIHLYKNAMPGGLSALIFIAFLIGFISFIEAFINWGSGFVVVDVFKTYIFKDKPDQFYTGFSYFIMLLIGVSGMLIAWYNTHLFGLQKFIFAMGAGVGPVFILRWFWWRINAWSQFSAMVSSLLFAVAWDIIYDNSGRFAGFVDRQLDSWNISFFAFKLLCLTLIVTIIWILVTFLTKPDNRETLDNFVKTLNPGGIWPGTKKGELKVNWRKVLMLLLFPVVSILPFLSIWTFKFKGFISGSGMVMLWIVLIYFIVKKMGRDENEIF